MPINEIINTATGANPIVRKMTPQEYAQFLLRNQATNLFPSTDATNIAQQERVNADFGSPLAAGNPQAITTPSVLTVPEMAALAAQKPPAMPSVIPAPTPIDKVVQGIQAEFVPPQQQNTAPPPAPPPAPEVAAAAPQMTHQDAIAKYLTQAKAPQGEGIMGSPVLQGLIGLAALYAAIRSGPEATANLLGGQLSQFMNRSAENKRQKFAFDLGMTQAQIAAAQRDVGDAQRRDLFTQGQTAADTRLTKSLTSREKTTAEAQKTAKEVATIRAQTKAAADIEKVTRETPYKQATKAWQEAQTRLAEQTLAANKPAASQLSEAQEKARKANELAGKLVLRGSAKTNAVENAKIAQQIQEEAYRRYMAGKTNAMPGSVLPPPPAPIVPPAGTIWPGLDKSTEGVVYPHPSIPGKLIKVIQGKIVTAN